MRRNTVDYRSADGGEDVPARPRYATIPPNKAKSFDQIAPQRLPLQLRLRRRPSGRLSNPRRR